jgi:hypothetical protein
MSRNLNAATDDVMTQLAGEVRAMVNYFR